MLAMMDTRGSWADSQRHRLTWTTLEQVLHLT